MILEELKEKYLSGVPIREIAKREGVTTEALYYQLRKFENWRELQDMVVVKKRLNKNKELIKMYNDGVPRKQIAKKLNRGLSTVQSTIRVIFGKQPPQNVERDKKICGLYLNGMKYKDIAIQCGVCKTRVQCILRRDFGDTWEKAKEGRKRLQRLAR